jgi:hypothetical protein
VDRSSRPCLDELPPAEKHGEVVTPTSGPAGLSDPPQLFDLHHGRLPSFFLTFYGDEAPSIASHKVGESDLEGGAVELADVAAGDGAEVGRNPRHEG